MLKKLDLDGFRTTQERTAEFLELHAELDRLQGVMFRAFRELPDLIPETLQKAFSGHTFPLLQAEDELLNCLALAYIGFYQHAIAGLRWVLELGVLSVYWDRTDTAERDIQEWLASRARTPFKRRIVDGLMGIPNVARYCEQSTLREDLATLYGELSDYQHVKGLRYSSHQHTPIGSSVHFNEDAFRQWLELAYQVVRLVTTVHLLKYPVALQDTPVDQKFGLNGPMGGFLNPWQADELRSLFDTEELEKLQEISDLDPEASALAEEFRRRPNITEEQLQQQFLRDDQFWIEQQGFRSWLREELRLHGAKGPDAETDADFRSRVAELKAWASERGWLEHGRHGPRAVS